MPWGSLATLHLDSPEVATTSPPRHERTACPTWRAAHPDRSQDCNRTVSVMHGRHPIEELTFAYIIPRFI